ncbi:MAG: AraC family ligand binding domain-containing protein, partial [Clostridiales bacterium]|nr:AraC family ligand binding domain-containing protein [Clostridiales bacterium]
MFRIAGIAGNIEGVGILLNLGMKLSLDVPTSTNITFHPDYELLYLLDGGLDVLVNGREVLMKKADLLMINTGESHNYTVSAAGTLLTVYIDTGVFDDLLRGG